VRCVVGRHRAAQRVDTCLFFRQQESEQRAVALLSRNTVLEEELTNYKVGEGSGRVAGWCSKEFTWLPVFSPHRST